MSLLWASESLSPYIFEWLKQNKPNIPCGHWINATFFCTAVLLAYWLLFAFNTLRYNQRELYGLQSEPCLVPVCLNHVLCRVSALTVDKKGTQQGQLNQSDQRGIPHRMESCSDEWGALGVMSFVYQIHSYMWWSPASLDMAQHLSACPWDVVKEFCVLLCLGIQLLLFLWKCLYLNPWVSSFYPSNSLPQHSVGEWISSWVVFSCQKD